MKKLTAIVVITFVLSITPVFATYSGGTGEPNDPWQISCPNDLLYLGSHPADYNSCFILTADINLAACTVTTAVIAPDINSVADNFQGVAWLVSGIELILEENGFVAQTGYTEEVFAISGVAFTAGMSLQTLEQNTRRIVEPVRNSSGQIISGYTANKRCLEMNPGYSSPYKPASLASEGKIASGTDLVRVYTENMEGQWAMPRSEIVGLSPYQIANKYSLKYVPTNVVNVNATGTNARIGIAKDNFGYTGGGVQVEFLGKGAEYYNPRTIPSGGIK